MRSGLLIYLEALCDDIRLLSKPEESTRVTAPQRIAVICMHSSPWQPPGTEDVGGMNVYVRETARELVSLGWSVDVFTRSQSRPGVTEIQPALRLIHVEAGPLELSKDHMHEWLDAFVDGVLLYSTELRSLTSESGGSPYVAVISHYWLSGLAGACLAAHWGLPLIAGFHTLSIAKQHAFHPETATSERINGEQRVVKRADRLLAMSEHERDVLQQNYGACIKQISVVAPGVDQAKFSPSSRREARLSLDLPPDCRIALGVARPTPIKGLNVLLDALARMQDHTLNTLLVGFDADTREGRRLKQSITRLGLEGRVRIIGGVSHDLMPAYYAAADLCVIPSYYESFGMVALEAISCGRPVVASRVGGMTAIIRDNVDGRLVTAGAAGELANAMKDVLNSDWPCVGDTGAASRSWSETTHAMLTTLEAVA